MSEKIPLSLGSPESRGAQILPEAELLDFLETTLEASRKRSRLCGLVLVTLKSARGYSVSVDDQHQAAHIIGQLMRQADAVGVRRDGCLAVVLHELERRGDAHVMLDRLESFARAAGLPWTLTIGVGVFPLSGRTSEELFDACLRDLEGAMSSDTWEHLIPRDTLLTRSAG